MLADLHAVRGRIDEADRGVLQAAEAFEELQRPENALVALAKHALPAAVLMGDVERSAQRLDRTIARISLDRVAPVDRPYLDLAVAHALAGRPDAARALLTEYESGIRPYLGAVVVATPNWQALPSIHSKAHHAARGAVALAEGSADQTVAELRRAAALPAYCRSCYLPLLGLAYETAQHPDSATAVHERYLDAADAFRLQSDGLWLGPVLERLGELHLQAGRMDLAGAQLARLVELWADADPALQPRVEAARRTLVRLRADE